MAGFEATGWIKAFSHVVQAFALALMAIFLPAAPIACAIMSGRTQFLRQYATSVKRSGQSLRALYQADVIARNLERCMEQLFLGPSPVQYSVQGTCTHCGKCCLDSACVFLEWSDSGQSRCSIYNNWFWKLTSCGAYPIDAQSIAVYDCQAFKTIPIRTIHIMQVPGRQA